MNTYTPPLNPHPSESRLLARIFGFPIWTIDHDWDMRKRRARRLPNGQIVTRKISGRILGYEDGTFPSSCYVTRWMHRDTLLG